MKEWHFFDKVYRVWVVLVIGDHDELLKFMDDYKHLEDISEPSAKGMTIRVKPGDDSRGSNCTVMWLRKWEMDTLIHELAHLVMFVFDDQGVPISRENTEAFSFYQEFWYDEIVRAKRRLPNGRTPAQARRGL